MSLKLEIESQPLKKAMVGGHNKHTTNPGLEIGPGFGKWTK